MAIVLPHTFQDGVSETASGVQVMENLNVLKAAIEAGEAATAAAQLAARATTIHNPAEQKPGVGSWLKAPTADAITIKVPSGGRLVLVSATVAITKTSGSDCSVWLWPLVSASGAALIGTTFLGAHPPTIDEVFTLSAQGAGMSGWTLVGNSGAGNIPDQINTGGLIAVGGIQVWMPEGNHTLELLYSLGAAGDNVHNRFVGAAVVGP